LEPTDSILKTRKSVKENFAYALLLGVEEAAERGEVIGAIEEGVREN
jgi:hypothetical protein